ncbi:Pof6 interactor protein 1 [Fulvia fulva]|uniref:Pof6 interactor protein 1 n=1 Tax=Passalora fulva TaxID=5499 RepID=A0A9Q8LA26_PASFU|nr:Pof6 interactor protein 1 [Fulvia fulva]KAK4632053.1 Pof6 interactor protein 1 [Fulvia fulva]KAK4632944.1 Pof6 interactor protein 1 [Fulvia fulva]UJO13653.1 Pof6 interactor protein 1 [Fulvia fulva]WPV11616.1 Pof6 interactor protein 1 [Fulvia fulva]WPV25891.1 Pof6 interactor protein 1 [Fulvia fulva]
MADPESAAQPPTKSVNKPATTTSTTTNGTKEAAAPTSAYELDVSKLHSLPSEQQGLYLLTFTADLAKHVEDITNDEVSAEQVALKKELFQVIDLASPAPTRVIRKNVGRCFHGILTKGSRKILYESINELVAIVNAGKDKDARAKHAAVYCLGVIFDAAGDSAISLSPLACTAVLKLLKPAASDTALRSAIFQACGKIAKGIAVAIDEDLGRAIWKQARNAAGTDRSLLVQANACWCLEQLIRYTSYFDNSSDFDKLQAALLKAMESASVRVRHAAASSLATELVKSYTESPNKDAVPKMKKPKKSKKTGLSEEGDEAERASSPAPEKSATALSYGLLEIFRLLSTHFCKPATPNRARAGIAVCYIKVLRALGEGVVEQKYGEIVNHLFKDLLDYPGWQYNQYRQLMCRKFVRIILDQVIGGMIGETAQMNACRFLLNDIIKDYPQTVKERPEPSKAVLTGAISALTSLTQRLDTAIGTIAEGCREGLLQVLQHPSFTVQVHAARALRTFTLACPQQLLPTVTICMNSVSRELNLLGGPRQSQRRCIGYAHGLAAILSTSSQHPLYGSVDVYARVLQQATNLLKSSGSSDLRVSSCQLQVAWIMIGGLMSLGPNFVKIHVAQLMLLWRNALPKPVSSDHISKRNMLELSYLAHVRECALGSIKAFLTYNQRLLTSDISRRLSVMLENTVTFLQGLPSKRTSDDPSNRLSAALQLQDYEVMVRRRVFQCFSQLLSLSPAGSLEATAHSTILPIAVASFSDSEYDAPNSLSAAIASSASTFESIWDLSDNYGFGVSGCLRGLDIRNPITGGHERHWTSRSDQEAEIDQAILSPVGVAAENDPTSCYLSSAQTEQELPGPPATEVVNAAIAAFGLSLPLQSPKVQDSTIQQISSSINAPMLQKDPARKVAIVANVALALSMALRVTTGDLGSARGELKSMQAEKGLQALLHLCIKDPDDSIRCMAAAALGRLCSSSGTAFTSSEVTYLTETIVNNREPYVRAGCASALAHIHSQLGGMAAGLHMKNIVGILMSLAADTHPLVHFWALGSLATIAESAGLNFSGYVTTTIGLLSQLYVSDSHNIETVAQASSNMSMDLPVAATLARGVDALINVLGPDLQDMAKARDMILTMVRLFSREEETAALLESLRCLEHLSLYAPGHMEFVQYVRRLQDDIDSPSEDVSKLALHGLFTLMRRDAPEIVRVARPGLEERLWEYLNFEPSQQAVRNIFLNWLQQTGSSDPADWIRRCNDILTKTMVKADKSKTAVAKSATATAGVDLQDEEVAGFAVTAGASKEDEAEAASSTQELMRWQVRLFAMQCLHNLIAMIQKEATVSDDTPGEAALQQKVADVIRIAFSASTAGVAALRVVGMQIIDQILKMFGRTPDPDFQEAMLLEQYQAQISSALTPAFAADSSPELAGAAVNVCATFIATGIVTDIERMGRILKTLVSALDSFSQDTDTASIGDLKGLSSSAQVMVRMAVFAAWAELQIASAEQKYLAEVVKPHIAQLVPLWILSLREYARLRFEPEISATTTTPATSGDLDTVYAALNRETLLKFYHASWLSLVDAIASLIDEDSDFVFDALDNKQLEQHKDDNEEDGIDGTIARKNTGINYREEPVAFFFVLYGLAFESLAVRSGDDDVMARRRNLDILEALKKIIRPSVSGNAIYQEVVFAETMDLLDRMVLTESLSMQSIIVEIARNLCLVHPSSRQGLQTPINGEAQLSDDIEQLFELTRIIVLVIGGLVPGLAETPVSAQLESSEEATSLVRASLQALVDVSEVFPSIIKTDLHASILHIFVTILGTASCQTAVVPQALPIFRRFIASIVEDERPQTKQQVQNAFKRMLAILRNAQKREAEASLPCEKNTLLTITILLSAAQPLFESDDPLMLRFIGELRECLSSPMTTKVTAGCYRTLLLQSVATRLTFSHAVNFLLNAPDLEGMAETKSVMAQTLTTYTATKIAPDQRPAAIVLVIKTLLSRAAQDGQSVYPRIAARLLELAAADNTTFRTLVGSLAGGEKQLMEKILKSQTGNRGSRQDFSSDREPTIALKMNFGG